jgi:thiol-disulfide isomerase/thioredoxin
MQSFDSFTGGPAVLFVKAEWCGHCQAAKPEMQAAARTLKPKGVAVFAIDSEVHAEVVKELKVNGFPTIMYRAPNGQRRVYSGERKAQSIAKWACQQAGC